MVVVVIYSLSNIRIENLHKNTLSLLSYHSKRSLNVIYLDLCRFFEVDGLLCSTIVGKYDVNLLVGLNSLIVLDDNFHTSRCLYGILC